MSKHPAYERRWGIHSTMITALSELINAAPKGTMSLEIEDTSSHYAVTYRVRKDATLELELPIKAPKRHRVEKPNGRRCPYCDERMASVRGQSQHEKAHERRGDKLVSRAKEILDARDA